MLISIIVHLCIQVTPGSPGNEPSFVSSEGKTCKLNKGKSIQIGDFQLKLIGELSTEMLPKSDSDSCKGGQWLCNCTALLSGELTTRYVPSYLRVFLNMYTYVCNPPSPTKRFLFSLPVKVHLVINRVKPFL